MESSVYRVAGDTAVPGVVPGQDDVAVHHRRRQARGPRQGLLIPRHRVGHRGGPGAAAGTGRAPAEPRPHPHLVLDAGVEAGDGQGRRRRVGVPAVAPGRPRLAHLGPHDPVVVRGVGGGVPGCRQLPVGVAGQGEPGHNVGSDRLGRGRRSRCGRWCWCWVRSGFRRGVRRSFGGILRRAGQGYGGAGPRAAPGVVAALVEAGANPRLVCRPFGQPVHGVGPGRPSGVGVAPACLVVGLVGEVTLPGRGPGDPVVRGGRVGAAPGDSQLPRAVAGEGQARDAPALLLGQHAPGHQRRRQQQHGEGQRQEYGSPAQGYTRNAHSPAPIRRRS